MTICLLSKELLLPQNIPTSYPYTHSINADIQKCVASLGVHDDPNTCPVDGWYVRDKKYLISNFDIQPYVNRAYSFTTDVEQPLIAVFNGYLILLCDGEKLVHVVQPAYSGLQQCQGGVFETLPNQGSAPDGVYLVKYSEIQDVEKLNLDQKSWGKYRIPLRPAKETDTHGRTGMYFHGTTVADKRQSAGCISLGTGIDAFIDDFYLGKNRDMVIIVNKVDFVDEEWNYRPYESH